MALVLLLGACSSDDSSSDDASSDTTEAAGADVVAEPFPGEVDDDTIEILGQWEVDGDEILGDVPDEHQEVWDRFAELFPADTRPEVNLYVPIDADASGGTDGAMQTDPRDPNVYYIALDATGADEPEELDRTMIHEFAHLMTLREEQVPRDEDAIDTCEVYSAGDGCPAPESYLAQFSAEFWPGVLFDDIEDGNAEATTARYEADIEAFVTEYAATSPSEDIAEIFAEWVLADELPTGDTVAEQKMYFFEDFPEAIAIRDNIRENLGY